MPKVTVIIPTCNRSASLRNAMGSVLAQTFKDFEIVVVDDASSDDTGKVVKEFEGKPIQYIRHEKNKGGSGARNTGIAQSQSEYIAFLDDDDEWMPTKLALQVALFEKSSPQVGLIYTGCQNVDRATEKVLGIREPTKKGDISADILCGNCIGSTSSTLIKRRCFEEIGLFDETLPSFQDYDLWIRLAAKFSVEYVPQLLLKYYTHGNKIWTNPEAVRKGIRLILEKHKTNSSMLRKYLSQYMLGVGEMYCMAGNLSNGRLAYLQAIKMHPFRISYYLRFALSLLGPKNLKRLKGLKQGCFSR